MIITLDNFLKFKLLYEVYIDLIYDIDFNIWEFNNQLYLEIFTLVDNNSKTGNILIDIVNANFVNFIIGNPTYLELVNLATIKYKVTRSYINYSVLEIETLLDSDDIYHKMPQDAFDENMYDDDTINNLYDLFPDLKTLRLFK